MLTDLNLRLVRCTLEDRTSLGRRARRLRKRRGDQRLDPGSHRVTAAQDTVKIGPTEFRMLRFFMDNQERVFTRSRLLDNVWGNSVYVEERTVDVHIRRLRKRHFAPPGACH